MQAQPKVLFLGICAGAHSDFWNWCKSGVLPSLQGFAEQSLIAQTRSVPALYVQCTWPSFYTGTGPARQGYHSWEQLKSGTYEFYRAYTPDHIRTTPFWDYLSHAGKRVAILDIPHSGPSSHINGVQLVEWGAHDANHGFLTSPPALAEEVVANFGHHPQRGLCDADRNAHQLAKFRDDLLKGVKVKAEITRHFLAQEKWDFFAQVFTESHCIGHQAWHLHDRTHPRYKEADRAIAGDPVLDVSRAIDHAIGEILASVDSNTTVILLASHGMRPKYVAQFMLADILVRLGVAQPARSAGNTSIQAKRVFDSWLTWGWQHTPQPARRLLEPMRHSARAMVQTPPSELPLKLDPAAGKCFLITNNHTHGGIRVNLVGREPQGRVQPGEEYEALLEQLTADLLAIKNVETGNPIVTKTIRTSDLYSGDGTEHFPDLMVEWAGIEPVRTVESPKIGKLTKEYVYCRTGEHLPAGLMLARGPGIPAGHLNRQLSILDFAPTFCEAFGVPAGTFDGAVIPELAEPLKRSILAGQSSSAGTVSR